MSTSWSSTTPRLRRHVAQAQPLVSDDTLLDDTPSTSDDPCMDCILSARGAPCTCSTPSTVSTPQSLLRVDVAVLHLEEDSYVRGVPLARLWVPSLILPFCDCYGVRGGGCRPCQLTRLSCSRRPVRFCRHLQPQDLGRSREVLCRIQYCLEPWDCIEHLGTVLSACVE